MFQVDSDASVFLIPFKGIQRSLPFFKAAASEHNEFFSVQVSYIQPGDLNVISLTGKWKMLFKLKTSSQTNALFNYRRRNLGLFAFFFFLEVLTCTILLTIKTGAYWRNKKGNYQEILSQQNCMPISTRWKKMTNGIVFSGKMQFVHWVLNDLA